MRDDLFRYRLRREVRAAVGDDHEFEVTYNPRPGEEAVVVPFPHHNKEAGELGSLYDTEESFWTGGRGAVISARYGTRQGFTDYGSDTESLLWLVTLATDDSEEPTKEIIVRGFKGWEMVDPVAGTTVHRTDGKKASDGSDRPRGFHPSSHIGAICGALNKLGLVEELLKAGRTPDHADFLNGYNLVWENVKIGEVNGKDNIKLLPVKYLGQVDIAAAASGVPASARAAAAPSANGAGNPEAVRKQIQDIYARHTGDHDGFFTEALPVADSTGSEALKKLVLSKRKFSMGAEAFDAFVAEELGLEV